MKEMINEYIKDKCMRCKNQNSKIEEDKCNIKIFQYGDYKYCKCCNMSDANQEIKKKII